ncbi:MAG: DNA methyltransferase, partial [Gammaproteobacteria bacterium]
MSNRKPPVVLRRAEMFSDVICDSRAPAQSSAAHRIQHADCRREMRLVKNESIAMVLTDPPYFIDGMDDNWNHERLRGRCKHGVIGGLPAGMKFSTEQGRKLYDFLKPVAAEWRRVLKPGGFALCFAQPRLSHRTAAAMEDAGFEIRDMLAWKYEGQAKAFSQEHFIRRRNLPEKEKQKMIRDLEG